jgi:plastocyanin
MALPVVSAAPSTVVVSMPSGAGAPAGAPGYNPDTITVVIGVNNTVMWTNNDTVAGKGTSHTVTPKTQPTGGNWPSTGSGNMLVNASYSFTFTMPGTYTYYCAYHSWMTGTVVVVAAATTSTATSTSTTPEFPAAALAVVLFAVIAAVIVAAPRLRPSRLAAPPN